MTAAIPIVSQSKLSIISAAVVACGEKAMNSLTDQRYAASVGAAFYDFVYENEIQSNRWRFACKKDALSQLNVTPANEFQFAFQLPPDMLLPIGFYGIGTNRTYEIYSNLLYTNVTSNPGPAGGTVPRLTFEYMFKPDPATLPAYFTFQVVLALASHMIHPITESDTAQQRMEQKYNMQRSRAMFADAQGRPNRPIQDQPFTQVR